MQNPFRYFNSSPEVIRLAVMMYIRYPGHRPADRGNEGVVVPLCARIRPNRRTLPPNPAHQLLPVKHTDKT